VADEKVMETAWESPVKRRLRDSQPVFGCTITTSSLDLAARAASAGFHFLWLELEHSPLTLETVRNIVLATRQLPAVPFARVPVTDTWIAKRVLDAGVHGVVFPFVSTPALARQAAHACRYPPAGLRGSGASLATTCWPEPEGYHDSADRNIVVVVIVEEATALPHIDEIAATPGVDVVFLGTGDLSFSLGLRGHQDHPSIDEAARSVLAATRRHDKIAGRPAGSVEQTRRYIEQGFLFFQAPSDLALLEAGAKQFLAPLGITATTHQRALY
jgi:2-keto-3-deoxy-L-rhamnonate aldolase RhmA